VREEIAPRSEAQGYDYFWRPTRGDDGPPFCPWFIKRDAGGVGTRPIDVVEMGFAEHWDRVLFRDYLIAHSETAAHCATLKRLLAAEFTGDRVRYTETKTSFIAEVTGQVKRACQDPTSASA